jgi:[NiFe] hydrogenase large subunit
MHAIFGGKNPHLQSLVVGGITSVGPDAGSHRRIPVHHKETQDFVEKVYIPDLLAVASFYKDWGGIGGTTTSWPGVTSRKPTPSRKACLCRAA